MAARGGAELYGLGDGGVGGRRAVNNACDGESGRRQGGCGSKCSSSTGGGAVRGHQQRGGNMPPPGRGHHNADGKGDVGIRLCLNRPKRGLNVVANHEVRTRIYDTHVSSHTSLYCPYDRVTARNLPVLLTPLRFTSPLSSFHTSSCRLPIARMTSYPRGCGTARPI